jgi:hypothetical protein
MNTSGEQKKIVELNKVGKSPKIDFPSARIIMKSSAGLWRWQGPQIFFHYFPPLPLEKGFGLLK